MIGSRTILVAHPGAELYGSDRVLLDSVIGLIHARFRVVVVLPEGGPLADELDRNGAEVRIAPSFVLRKRLMRPSGWLELISTALTASVATWRLLKRERPVALYVSTITLPLWPVLARARRVPTVLHIHEGEASASRLIKSILYAPALTADRILINSSFSRNVMEGIYPRLRARTEIVPNAVPGPSKPMPPRAELAASFNILYVGRLSPRKGPDLILEAAAILAERGITTSISIVGSAFEGYEWFERDLRSMAEQRPIQGTVTFHGFRPDIWPLLEEADLLIVPSRLDEPFGNTAVEGVLALRPVVVSSTSGLNEATAGVVTARRVRPDDARELSDAIASTLTGWTELVEKVEEARALVVERHSVLSYRLRVVRALEEVARVSY